MEAWDVELESAHFFHDSISGPAEVGGQGGHMPPQILATNGAKVRREIS